MDRILVKDIAVGTELVVVDTGNGWGIPSTRTATVAKILKQYIELDNGRRYRIAPGYKKDGTGNYLGHERKSPGHYVSDRSYTTLLLPDAPVLETWRISRRVQDAALHAGHSHRTAPGSAPPLRPAPSFQAKGIHGGALFPQHPRGALRTVPGHGHD